MVGFSDRFNQDTKQGHVIYGVDEDAKFHDRVMTVHRIDESCPVNPEDLAANMLDIFNGRDPSRRIDARGYQVNFTRQGDVLGFKFRRAGEPMGTPGLTVTLDEKSAFFQEGAETLNRFVNQGGVQKLCQSIKT